MKDIDAIKARLDALDSGKPELVYSKHVAMDYRRLIARVEKLESGLEQIAHPNGYAYVEWQAAQVDKGNDVTEWDWFAHVASTVLAEEGEE